MNGNILLGTVEVEATEVNVVDKTDGIEDFEGYGSRYALPTNDIWMELSFKVELTGDKDRINYLNSINGKQVLVSSKMFKTFRGRLSSKKHGVGGGTEIAIFDVTIKEYDN